MASIKADEITKILKAQIANYEQAVAVEEVEAEEAAPQAEAPIGIPISSPMNGIYYGAQSPSAPPFVKEGDTVTAGQVVALIEAMKVFNEIIAPVSGTVRKVVAQSGQVVGPGEPLMYIG